MSIRFYSLALLLMPLSAPNSAQAASSVWLDTLPLDSINQDFGSPHANATVDGRPITLAGQVYSHGVGTHASSTFNIPLDGKAAEFSATVGVDDETKGKGVVVFQVYADGKLLADSGVLHGGSPPKNIDVALAGAHELTLDVNATTAGIGFAHADWANARIVLAAGAIELPSISKGPVTIDAPGRLRLLPDDPRPAIHGPRITGASPGHPFIFKIPATGQPPLHFSTTKLPVGLALLPETGILYGSLRQNGATTVTVTVRGPGGVASRQLTIIGGSNKLALTPPMGWNSWNVWGSRVNEDEVKAAADALINSGLANHGYEYVNIDDSWEGSRDSAGIVQSNQKFPDMHGLTDYVHHLGLKSGLYSSPGPSTCAGFTGSYQHEIQDANTYAGWGFDYLKYDWCSYEQVPHTSDQSGFAKPYDTMHQALESTNRDIVFSMCQYGFGDVWKWGAQAGGNTWRTAGDVFDNWGSIHSTFENQAGHEIYGGPGHWNDPDMLVVGQVGWGKPHPSGLKPNEQILHISLWCLLSAPLIVGCDLTKLDPFTLGLLTNDEVLDIDQDPLGHPASQVVKDFTGGEIWARPLFDGAHAVGLVNTNPWVRTITVNWSDLGINEPQSVRDLWLHTNIGVYNKEYSVEVPAHGCVLLKISRAH